MFLMRFDMRCPRDEPGASQALYETALEMARWGEEKGCIQLVVSEHHHHTNETIFRSNKQLLQ